MRTLEMNEVQDVSGGIVPLIAAIVAIDVCLNVFLIGVAVGAHEAATK